MSLITSNLNNVGETIDSSNDSIVIVDNFQSIRGGRTLDTTGFPDDVIAAGHVIIKKSSDSTHKPMPVIQASVGNVATHGAITAGAAYTNGVYENVPLTGGSGTGALATVTVAGGVVTVVAITNGGKDYVAGDVLSFDPLTAGGTGAGFSTPVATVGVTAAAYQALPAGHEYVGILIATILTKKPFAGIMTRGTANPAAMKYPITAIQAAFLTAVTNRIDLRADQ